MASPEEDSKSKQKNFSLGRAKAWFEGFCDEHGYDQKTVFLGGVLALTEMSHDQRRAYFSRVSRWERSEFTTDVPGPPT